MGHERWSRMQHLGRSAPKGDSDVLNRAIAELGALDSEHKDQLQHLCPCQACVSKFIIEVATEFNARQALIEGAPRKRVVVENLQRAVEATASLVAALRALDDYSRESLVELSDLDRILPTVDLYKAARANLLPTPETAKDAALDGQWVEHLRALERYIYCRLNRIAWIDEDDPVPVDKGGNTNVMKDRFGPPAWYLVRNSWDIFENCRPGVATASETGPFLRFVNCIYEYATDEIEENSTLHHWIKKLARPLRHHDQLLKKLGPLECELDDLKVDAATPEGNARIAELESDLPALRKEVVDAYLALNHRKFRPKS